MGDAQLPPREPRAAVPARPGHDGRCASAESLACRDGPAEHFVENFALFDERQGDLNKLAAKSHQFLGVNNAIAAEEQVKKNKGKLGAFWHTRGSSKSYSMLFSCQRCRRKIPGNWTFVIITDREDLGGTLRGSAKRSGN